MWKRVHRSDAKLFLSPSARPQRRPPDTRNWFVAVSACSGFLKMPLQDAVSDFCISLIINIYLFAAILQVFSSRGFNKGKLALHPVGRHLLLVLGR